jgi:hypothetical protein
VRVIWEEVVLMVIALLAAAAVVAVAVVAGLAVLVAGIQVSERRTGLQCPPRRGADAFARWILSAHVSQPEASAARLGTAPGQRPRGTSSPCSPARPASSGRARRGESS